MSVVAAFDFDGTLSTRDCVVPFLTTVSGRARLARGLMARPVALAGAAVRRDRDALKAMSVRAAFAGREVLHVERLGATFGETVHASGLRADTTKRLEWHQQQGHSVVIASASLGTYLHPIGRLLGVDAVLCTEVQAGADGRYTGGLVGANCRGEEKMRRLRAWLAEAELDDAELWAYGDSNGDREMLAAADHALLVKDISVPVAPVRTEAR